ncbi:MAG TPA: hypothetical protein VFW95_11815 [Candidatus Limnocylindria bacterium]|nr:hypothetical protein [Candidatus Limnocylindria bacterium]
MASQRCEVRALPPIAEDGSGGATSVVAEGQYLCPTDGQLTVTLLKPRRFLGWVTASTQTFDAPKTDTWSRAFRTPPVECLVVEYRSVVTHTHPDQPDGGDEAGSRPCPSTP